MGECGGIGKWDLEGKEAKLSIKVPQGNFGLIQQGESLQITGRVSYQAKPAGYLFLLTCQSLVKRPYGNINSQVLYGAPVNKTGSFNLKAAGRQRDAGAGS